MGLFSSDKREANQRLRQAHRALDDNGKRERRAGIKDETDEYLRLNQAVIDAEKDASWWARFNR